MYAIADSLWIESGGSTPGGLTLPELEAQMQGARNTSVAPGDTREVGKLSNLIVLDRNVLESPAEEIA